VARDDPDYVFWDVFIKESIDGVQTKKPLQFHKCTEEDWELFGDPVSKDRKAIERIKKQDVLYCLHPDE